MLSLLLIIRVMNKIINYVFCITLLAGLISLQILSDSAWAQTPYTGRFTLTQACRATTSISGRNPIPLEINQAFEAVGLNRQNNPTHVLITIPNTNNRWVALTCGQLNPAIAINSGGDTPVIVNPINQFIPFFDNDPSSLRNRNGIDITPPPPVLNEFDVAINRLCGDPGTEVSRADFQETLQQFPDVIARIKENVGGSLVAGRTSDDEFLEDLTNIWFNVNGFDHVFCGEPGRNIGGLHFAGRYLDLQQRNLAGILRSSIDNAEVIPGAVYTIGVVMQVGDRQVSSPIKGYAYTLNAEELLELGAKVYEDNPNLGTRNEACLVGINNDGQTFDNVFVARDGGIRTFYSDATPDTQGTSECNISS